MPSFTYPELPLDGLLRRAAIRHPGRAALVTESGTVDHAELDDRADRIARYLEHTVGRREAAVGVANVLDPAFPAAFYGAVRGGSVAVLVNPLIREAVLHHVFAAAGIEVAFVPRATAELLVKLRESLPKLRTIVVTDAEDGVVPADAVPLQAALDAVPEGPGGRGLGAAAPGAIACVQFTTGTTGRPKGVRLTHRNLVANAAQTVHAHALGPQSVTLNHLPLYHVMHLNSALYAGATQILCRDPDPVASLALAARTGATHYYGLPARLHRLAADPRLEGRPEGVPAGPRLTAVLSGGNALAEATARRLRDLLGVPVIQGYGLAELSPLSHSQRPGDGSRRGCVGPAVPGTECRIVDLGTGEDVGVYATGEVHVRGPQLMAGYLDENEPSRTDADGWFATGDVGYLDEDGALFLVDRLGDVFKYDNELVSPTAVERILAEDPRVADCVVSGWPDPVHGAVVWAGIVLYQDAGQRWCSVLDILDSITEKANAQLASFEQIRRVETLDAVPRTPVGKPRRLELRQELRARAAAESAA
ncbi:class I adenylate-forming enzyme family protein [Streptomyces sp.]|uniref:class I adenylate-forming enzyme family protein n=1 Tax=Streptomyces sp. TaxID=1931 RepID=UPI002D7664DC|nr:class I adenylate-forming enzyme family protein [Streptomyces sp.]HET6354356.1 class I adenylate-forming enzyme family protein [Streptomyces sp.]